MSLLLSTAAIGTRWEVRTIHLTTYYYIEKCDKDIV